MEAVTEIEKPKVSNNKKFDQCKQELDDLQKEFTDRIKEIRSKYFKERHQLIVMPGKENYEVAFSVDYGAFREPSEL